MAAHTCQPVSAIGILASPQSALTLVHVTAMSRHVGFVWIKQGRKLARQA